MQEPSNTDDVKIRDIMGELSSLFTDAIEQVDVSVYSLISTPAWLACLITSPPLPSPPLPSRRLGLESAVEHVLKQYSPLKSYFLSNAEQARFKRLKKSFQDSMTEIFLYSYQTVLPSFTCFNQLLQRSYPCIFFVYKGCWSIYKKILSKLLKVDKLETCLRDTTGDLVSVLENQRADKDLFVGVTTRMQVNKCLASGDISDKQAKFYTAVRQFYIKADTYMLKKLALMKP